VINKFYVIKYNGQGNERKPGDKEGNEVAITENS
jgi:hypothetical protein